MPLHINKKKIKDIITKKYSGDVGKNRIRAIYSNKNDLIYTNFNPISLENIFEIKKYIINPGDANKSNKFSTESLIDRNCIPIEDNLYNTYDSNYILRYGLVQVKKLHSVPIAGILSIDIDENDKFLSISPMGGGQYSTILFYNSSTYSFKEIFRCSNGDMAYGFYFFDDYYKITDRYGDTLDYYSIPWSITVFFYNNNEFLLEVFFYDEDLNERYGYILKTIENFNIKDFDTLKLDNKLGFIVLEAFHKSLDDCKVVDGSATVQRALATDNNFDVVTELKASLVKKGIVTVKTKDINGRETTVTYDKRENDEDGYVVLGFKSLLNLGTEFSYTIYYI